MERITETPGDDEQEVSKLSSHVRGGGGGPFTPVPDPSILTTQQTKREIQSLRELVFIRLDAMDKAMELFNANITRVPTDTDRQIQHLKELHETRFNEMSREVRLSKTVLETRIGGMDEAIKLLQTISDRFPLRVDEKISALHSVHDEKFDSIQVQFKERDTRTEQTSKDSKVAVDAALQAAKEAVAQQNIASATAIAKSEVSTTKQIDQLSVQISSSNKATDDKIDDLKQRLNRIEGKSEGISSSWLVLLGAVTLIMGLIGIGAFVFANHSAITKEAATPPQILYVPAPATVPPTTPAK